MKEIPEYLDENIEIINNLINKAIAKVIYRDDKPDYYYIAMLDTEELIIKLSYNLNTIEFCGFTSRGIDIFFDVFPTAFKIDLKNDNSFINTIKFINTYLTGINYDCSISSLSDFKYESGFTNMSDSFSLNFDFSYVYAFVYDIDGFNLSFNYDYIIDIDDGVLYHDSTITFSNKRLIDETFIIVNSPIMLKSEMRELLTKYGSSKLGIKLEELRLKDSTLISIINI